MRTISLTMAIFEDSDVGSSCSLEPIILVYDMLSTVVENFSRSCISFDFSVHSNTDPSGTRTLTKRMHLVTMNSP